MKVTPYLQLMRPPNLLTAVADIWAGVALSGYTGNELLARSSSLGILLLSIATVCLYAGGVVFNDVFDSELDSKERPERPIPSGRVGLKEASVLAVLLLTAGIVLALAVSLIAAIIAFGIALFAVIYDKWGKNRAIFGPFNMGLCRGGNLLLGISIIPASLPVTGYLAIVPVVYIMAVTIISRGEVHGGKQLYLYASLILYLFVIVVVMLTSVGMYRFWSTLVFLLIFVLMVIPPLWKAVREPVASKIGKAVKSGVLGLILLDAAWVAASAGIIWAIITAMLLPLSWLIARKFAVT